MTSYSRPIPRNRSRCLRSCEVDISKEEEDEAAVLDAAAAAKALEAERAEEECKNRLKVGQLADM